MTDGKIDKWQRVTGTDRATFGERIRAMYLDQRMSIREIADATGRSYGAIHTQLCEMGIELRPRGNPRA